jgi:hypothetical protein
MSSGIHVRCPVSDDALFMVDEDDHSVVAVSHSRSPTPNQHFGHHHHAHPRSVRT